MSLDSPDNDNNEYQSTASSPGSDTGLECPPANILNQTKMYKCKQCSFKCLNKEDYWLHQRQMHIKPEKLLECSKCQFVTEYKHHLEYHLRNHMGSKPYKCQHCEYTCVNLSMLRSHLKSHSKSIQYNCAECTYSTKYYNSLKAHLDKFNHTCSTSVKSSEKVGKKSGQSVVVATSTSSSPSSSSSSSTCSSSSFQSTSFALNNKKSKLSKRDNSNLVDAVAAAAVPASQPSSSFGNEDSLNSIQQQLQLQALLAFAASSSSLPSTFKKLNS